MSTGLLASAIIGAKKSQSSKPKNSSMILVHANKKELDELDKAQGGSKYVSGTNIRSYKKLGQAFKNPKLQEMTLKAARIGKSMGGSIQDAHKRLGRASGGNVQQMKNNGRKGDTELALFPKHMADHFDRMMGKRSINPHDGKREYFDFSNLASGLGQFMGGMQQQQGSGGMHPGMQPGMQYGQSGQSGGGGGWGSALGQMAGMFANQMMKPKDSGQGMPQQGYQGQNQGQHPQSWQNAGINSGMQGMLSALQARQQGAGWGDAFKQGAMTGAGQFAQQAPISSMFGGQGGQNSYMSRMMNNPHLQAGMQGLGSAYNAYSQGNNLQNSLSHGLESTLSNYNNPYANSARSGLEAYRNTGDWRQGAMGAADSALSNFNNPHANSARSALQDYRNNGNAESAMMTGAGSLAQHYGHQNAANAIQGAQNARQQGAGWGEASQRGALEGLRNNNNPYANAGRAAIESNLRGEGPENALINGGVAGLSSMIPQQQQQGRQAPQQQPQGKATPQPQEDYDEPAAPKRYSRPASKSRIPSRRLSSNQYSKRKMNRKKKGR